jgi:predicted nucleic acid-binding Zn ribbon protein
VRRAEEGPDPEDNAGSVTDGGSSLDYHLDLSPVTDDGQRWQCHLCPSPVTAAFRTGSYTKFLCEPCAKKEWAGSSMYLGACVHCSIPVYSNPGYAYYITKVEPKPVVCSSSCNKAARLKRRKDARSLARTARACLVCGQQFVPTRTDAKTCSNKCRQAVFRERRGGDRKCLASPAQ